MLASALKNAYITRQEELATDLVPKDVSTYNYEQNITTFSQVPSIVSEEEWANSDMSDSFEDSQEVAMSLDECTNLAYHANH